MPEVPVPPMTPGELGVVPSTPGEAGFVPGMLAVPGIVDVPVLAPGVAVVAPKPAVPFVAPKPAVPFVDPKPAVPVVDPKPVPPFGVGVVPATPGVTAGVEGVSVVPATPGVTIGFVAVGAVTGAGTGFVALWEIDGEVPRAFGAAWARQAPEKAAVIAEAMNKCLRMVFSPMKGNGWVLRRKARAAARRRILGS